MWAQKKIDDLELLTDRASEVALQASSSQADAERLLEKLGFQEEIQDETRRLVSEFLLHTRAALDYVIFALSRLNTGVEQDGTQFPIDPCKQVFEKHRNGDKRDFLRHLTCEQVALVESVQPYNRFPLLKLFNKLSNVDKHRKFVKPMVSGTIRQIPYAHTDAKGVLSNKVGVNFEHSFYISLVDWEGRPAIEVLQDLDSNVTEIVELFDESLRS